MDIYSLYANRIGQILEAANVGLWDWNMQNDTVQFDAIWARLIGYDISEIEFNLSFWSDRVHPDDLEGCYKDINDHLNGKTDSYENIHRMKHKNGEWVCILDRGKVTAWEENKPVRFMGTHVDITELMKSRAKIDNLRNQAIKSAQSQSTYLANLSHEMRSPLNAIIGFSKLTLEDPLDESQRENIQFVHDSANKLLVMANDILDFSKIEAGKLEIYNSACQLNEVISNIIKTYQLNAEDKGVQLIASIGADVPLNIRTDAMRLNQILINLVGNSIKFTGKGGYIYLSVEVKQQLQNKLMLVFSVIDTGIGISADQRDKIFLEYNQESASTSHRYGGTGLGLSISSKLVQMMGGEIWLVSEKNIGSGFHFTIEVELVDVVDKSTESHNQIEENKFLQILNGKNVLLVEDDEINLELGVSILEKHGIKVKTASNGRDALGMISQQQFDCILMDCQMPLMNGADATRLIREQEQYKDLPIIAMTGNVMKKELDMMQVVGMNGHIAKPIDPDAMLLTIAKCINPV
jgi:PAS domain S-box-containing protein